MEELTHRLKEEPKVSRRDGMFGKEVLGEVKVNKISAIMDILWEEPATFIPFISGWEQTTTTSGFRAKIKRSGESGHP